mgnify:CR=1 FL=1
MSKDKIINLEDLPPNVTKLPDDEYIRIPLGSSFTDAEKEIIRSTLNYQKGNKTKTAEVLGIGRKTLHRKISEYGIDEKA